MAKDIIITPASGLVDFQGVVGLSSATIQLDNNGNLNISASSGDITLGNTASDVYVGDGINNVDIIFEQDGEIRGLTGKTLTLGQSDSYISFAGNITSGLNVSGVSTFQGNVYLSTVSATNIELIAGDIQSGVLTTTSTSPATVMSISASTYRSVQYQVQVTEGTNYNMTTINVIHDGTDTYMTEYGTIDHPIGIATFSSDISGGAIRLIGHPSFASTTTFKVIFTALEV